MAEKLLGNRDNLKLNPDSRIYFLWLSHKLSRSWEMLEAFCESTASGKIINDIIRKSGKWSTIYKTNLVKWVPLDNDWKIRYPTEKEKNAWLQRLRKEIFVFRPKWVYLFGKQVSDFILKNFRLEKLTDLEYELWSTKFILAEHPSYVAVYRRKHIEKYSNDIINRINTIN